MRLLSCFFAGLLALFSILSYPSLAIAASDEPLEGITAMPPVGVEVIHDGVNGAGQWTQTVRITIKPGGSLSNAAELLYSDVSRVDPLFSLAKQQNPYLISPAMVPVGLRIDVPIDPSKTYVLQSILNGQNTVVRRYTNGVVATVYVKPAGVLSRVVSFPAGEPTDLFVYPTSRGPVKVHPGGKLVDIVYLPGQSLSDVVGQIFGLTNYRAAADLSAQTGWGPSTWPPKPGETKQVVVKPIALYQQAPSAAQPIPNPDPVGRERQAEQQRQRIQAGIIPARQESFGTVYHVAVNDPKLTATDVSTLLFGSPDRATDVARAAGLETSNGPNQVAFDPHLFGRAFDMSVDYVDEQFVLSRKVARDGTTTIDLVDGAEITSYPTATSGPLRVVHYPTGYKRVFYRPPKILLDAAHGMALFHVASASWLSGSDANVLSQQYAAAIVWKWGPGVPRSPGDAPDSLQFVDSPAGPYLVAVVAPGPPPTLLGRLLDTILFRNPLVGAVAFVVVGSAIAVAVDLTRRGVRSLARPEW